MANRQFRGGPRLGRFLSELLEPVRAARPGDVGLTQLRAVARAERKQGYAAVRTAIRSTRHSKFVTLMHQWLSTKRWRQHGEQGRKLLHERVGKFASRVLNKRHKVAIELGRDFTALSPEERHHLRIALKKLRYTAEFFRSLYPKRQAKPYFNTLAQMQTCLGHMNDMVVAEHLLERLSTADISQRIATHLVTAGGVVVGWHACGASTSAQEAEANWREFCQRDRFW